MFCGKRNSEKLKKLQERALRFAFSDYTIPYSDLLKRDNFLSLSALRVRYLANEMYTCVQVLNPPYLNELFVSKDTRNNLRDSNRLEQPEFQTVRCGLNHFVTMVQNCGTPYQLTLSTLKIYITLRKILLNGAYRVNVMGLLYNDRHDIAPIWNLSQYFYRSYLCISVYLQWSYTRAYYIFMLSMIVSQSVFNFVSNQIFTF